MNNWCCEWFQLMIESYGEKGFSITAVKDESCDYRSFYLVSIPFERDIMDAFTDDNISWPTIKNSNGENILLAAAIELRIPMDYCIRCGADLKKLIKKNEKKFDKLTEIASIPQQP
ncbi:MAG: hypothetical protein D3909_02195 [Candidatus Electrothrix sp. ATG1]|nr:hypothetical protein [Candidatus Electrothrix sp. ATG1]MCI5212339.1 hypothetical protein [Candidatus Electrothrix sp. ATG2]